MFYSGSVNYIHTFSTFKFVIDLYRIQIYLKINTITKKPVILGVRAFCEFTKIIFKTKAQS